MVRRLRPRRHAGGEAADAARARRAAGVDPWPRRVAIALLAVSVLALLLDLARPAWVAPVRAAASDIVTPVQEALVLPGTERVRELTRERDELRATLQQQEDAATVVEQADALLGGIGERDVLPARVIGTAPGGSPLVTRRLTLDAGTLDGVEVDQPVVASDGLVGRVVQVHTRSSDVQIVGDPDMVVGVRIGAGADGDGGVLGTVTGTPPAQVPPRAPGLLSLTLVGSGSSAAEGVGPGDVVTTLGSPDGRPYPPGVVLGEVVSVDPDRGQLGRTAVVAPRVDAAGLDLVGIVRTRAREEPRAPVEGTP